MSKYSSLLATEHSVRHIGAIIAVAVANSPDTRQASPHTRVRSGINLVTEHSQTQLFGKIRPLLTGVVGNEGITINRRAIGEMNTENINLSGTVPVLHLAAILDALEGRNCFVLQAHIVRLQLGLPVGVFLRQFGLLVRRLRTVHESNDIRVQGVYFQHAADDIRERTQDTEWLVPVLISIAPRAPVHALAPGFLQTRYVGENVYETRAQDDFAGGVRLAIGVLGPEV